MMKASRKFVSSILVLVLVLGMTMTAHAASYISKYDPCTRCGTYNNSYGWDPLFRSQSDGRGPGTFCDYCNKVVPAGESHSYISVYDKYYFLCNGTQCSRLSTTNRVYTKLCLNTRTDHRITYIN